MKQTTTSKPGRGALLVMLAGAFITSLDFFIVNVALPSIHSSLHASPAVLQGIIAGYGLAFASGLILAGRLGDLYGRRRMFLLGTAVFTVASVVAAVAPNSMELLAARVVQGLGAALLTPQILATLGVMYTGKARHAAFTAYGVAVGMGGVLGQLLGGLLITDAPGNLGWRSIFLINIPVGLLILLLAKRSVVESKADLAVRRTEKLDLAGAELAAGSVAAILLPLIVGREQHWPLWTWFSFGLAVVLFEAFVWQQRRTRKRGGSPLIAPDLLQNRTFLVSSLGSLVFTMAMGSFFMIMALYLQQGRGLSALESGLVITVLGVAFFLAGGMAPKLLPRFGSRILVLGAVEVIVGYGLIALAASHIGAHGSIEWLVPGLLAAGFGMGFVLAPLANIALATTSPDRAAVASGILTTLQEVGGALGIALIGICFFGILETQSGTAAFTHALSLSLEFLIAALAVAVALFMSLPKHVASPEE